MEARSPFFESTVYKSFALQKVRKTLRLEGSKLTYRKDEGDDVEEGRMRLTASSTVVATSNLHRKRQGTCVPCLAWSCVVGVWLSAIDRSRSVGRQPD